MNRRKQQTRFMHGDFPFCRIVEPSWATICVKEGAKIGRYVNVAACGISGCFDDGSGKQVVIRLCRSRLAVVSEPLDLIVDSVRDDGLDLVVAMDRTNSLNDDEFVVDEVYPVYGGADKMHCEELLCVLGPRVDCGKPPTLTKVMPEVYNCICRPDAVRIDSANIEMENGTGCGKFIDIKVYADVHASFKSGIARFRLLDDAVVDGSDRSAWVIESVRAFGCNVVLNIGCYGPDSEQLLVSEVTPIVRNGYTVGMYLVTSGRVTFGRPFQFQEAGRRCTEKCTCESVPGKPEIMSRADLGHAMHRMIDEVCKGATHLWTISLALQEDKPRTYVGRVADHVDPRCEVFWIDAKDLEGHGRCDCYGGEALQKLRARVHDYDRGPYTLEIHRGPDVFVGIIRDVFLDEYETDSVRAVILLDVPAMPKRNRER